MADGINWGMLQPLNQMQPIQTATPQASSGGNVAPSPGTGESGQGALAQQQQLAIERQRLGMEQARQPGLLQGQQLTNQGQALLNQKSQMDIEKGKYEVAVRQKSSEAFITGKNKGGTDGGLDAMQNSLMENGDAEGALKLAQTREDIKKLQTDNGSAGIINIGQLTSQLVDDPASQDPRTGKVTPGLTGLQKYNQQYPVIKKLWPDAPDPKSFTSNGQFHDAFTTPVLATAGPLAQQQKADMEAKKNNDLYQAQQVVKERQQELQQAIKASGPKSQQATEAAAAYQQAQRNASRVASGNNYITGTVSSAKSILPSWLGGDSTEGAIKDNTNPQTPQTAPSPQSPASSPVPDGRITVKSPNGTLGHIPAAQLDEAIKSGYTQVK